MWIPSGSTMYGGSQLGVGRAAGFDVARGLGDTLRAGLSRDADAAADESESADEDAAGGATGGATGGAALGTAEDVSGAAVSVALGGLAARSALAVFSARFVRSEKLCTAKALIPA